MTEIKQNIHLGVKGEFNIQKRNEKGELIYESGFRPNLILDNFFARTRGNGRLGGTQTLRVGSGTIPPTPTQTALVNLLGSVNNGNNGTRTFSTDGTTWTLTNSWTFQFTIGSVVGNVSELGLSVGAETSPTVHTRALITDSGGNPTSITVTAAEQLTVIYRISMRGSEADVTGNITLATSNTTHSYIIRRAFWNTNQTMNSSSGSGISAILEGSWTLSRVYGNDGVFGAIGASVGGTDVGGTFTTPNTSVEKKITWNLGTNANSANATGGIKILASFTEGWKIQFTPSIPKDSTKTLSLVLEYTFDRI